MILATLTVEHSFGQKLYIGQMSGTSLDGCDLALVAIPGNPTPQGTAPLSVVAVDYHSYPEQLSRDLRESRVGFSRDQSLDLDELSQELTYHYLDRIQSLLRCCQQDATDITAIGLHGQTIWHSPPVSVQLGDANLLAHELGIKVVGDIRQADLRLGGQGAPIMPALHSCLWGDLAGTTVVVNLGGIANATVIVDGRLLYGYDTGPGNTLLDLCCRRHFSRPFDSDGALARLHPPHSGLLERMLAYPWFMHPPPRSTDQKYFNEQWLEQQISHFAKLSPHEVLSTLTELTAESIVASLHLCKLTTVIDRVILCGGGCQNQTLVERLSKKFAPVQVMTSDQYGYQSDFIEAIGMAWLADKTLAQQPLGINHLTGAHTDTVFGAVYSS